MQTLVAEMSHLSMMNISTFKLVEHSWDMLQVSGGEGSIEIIE